MSFVLVKECVKVDKIIKDFEMEINQNDVACDIAEKFIKVYYDNADKRRQLMNKLYAENAVFIWNGNGIHTPEKIQMFYNNLPVSEHAIYTLDSQPITNSTGNPMAFIIEVCGSVDYEKEGLKSFFQSFIISGSGSKWKITSDIFRVSDELMPVSDNIEKLSI